MQGKVSGQDARLIVATARRFWEFVKEETGLNSLSASDWLSLCSRHKIITGPIECPVSFTAKLWFSEDYDIWLIGYNWRAGDAELCHYLAHEFFEYLAVTDHDGLFEGLPGVRAVSSASGYVYCYDGGTQPSAIHHLIGQRGERICCRGR